MCNAWSEITTIPFSIAAPRTEGKTKWAKKKNCFSLATFHANSLFYGNDLINSNSSRTQKRWEFKG